MSEKDIKESIKELIESYANMMAYRVRDFSESGEKFVLEKHEKELQKTLSLFASKILKRVVEVNSEP